MNRTAHDETPVSQREPTESAQLGTGRFHVLWASAVYAVATLALAYPALAGMFLVSDHSDQYIAGYPFREFAAATLRETGSFPQWNPYLFGGMPFIAAMHGDIFYPTFLLRMIMPTDAAMTWSFAIHLFLAGLFTFLFLRAVWDRRQAGFYPPLVGGLAYMLSGQVASLVSPGHDGKLYVSALFPLGLWALVRGIRDGRNWAWGVIALVVGLAVLSPHPQLLQYMLLASGAYGIFVAAREARSGAIDRATAGKRIVFALGAVLVGAAIGAIQYLPVREYVAWSPRAGGLPDYAVATSYAWAPEDLLNAYLPQFSGILDRYWGRNGIHFHSEYVGAAVLVLVGAALAGWRKSPDKSELIFWAATLLIALLWALGSTTPFYRIPFALVPGTKFFRAPSTVFFVGSLAIAYLSAVGTRLMLDRQVSRRYLIGWGIFAAVVALLAVSGGLTGFARSLAPDQALDRVDANAANVVMGALRSALFVFLAAGAAWAISVGKIPARYAGPVLALVVALDLWSVMRIYWRFSEPASVLYARDATIDLIRNEKQPARVLAVQLAESPAGHVPNLFGDGLMAHQIRTVLGYHGNQLGRYNLLTGKNEGFRQVFNPAFWRLSNTRFLLTNVGDVPDLQRIAGPVRDATGTEVYLYRVPGENPYAWLAPMKVKAADEVVLGTILNPRFDPRTAALFSDDAEVDAIDNPTSVPPPLDAGVSVTSYSPGRVTLDLSIPAPKGSALVVSENFYPGWRATIDGRPAKTERTDLTLIGVELPEGARRVELAFSSDSYAKGKTITLFALAATALLILTGLLADRRRIA